MNSKNQKVKYIEEQNKELWDCIKDKNKEIEKLETILKEHQEHIQVLNERVWSNKYKFKKYKEKALDYQQKANHYCILKDIQNLNVIRYLNVINKVRREWSFWKDYYKTPYDRMNWLLKYDTPMYRSV